MIIPSCSQLSILSIAFSLFIVFKLKSMVIYLDSSASLRAVCLQILMALKVKIIKKKLPELMQNTMV